MASKIEIIKELSDASERVLKRSQDGAAIATSLEAARECLQKAMAAVSSGEINFDTLYKHMYSARAVLDSIYNGYPMVPAEKAEFTKMVDEVLKGAATKDMEPDAFVAHAIEQLELAEKAPREEAVKRVLALKAAMLMWEDLPEGTNVLPVKIVENPHPGAGSAKPSPTSGNLVPGASAFYKGADRLAAIGKAETPPAKTENAPVKERWTDDLSPRRTYNGRR